jgi:carbon storage regulator
MSVDDRGDVNRGPRRHRDAKEVRMLVLSRKPLQSIVIGPDIRITIVKVERNQVRIGIEAPRDVTILRDELIGTGEAERTVGPGAGASGHVVAV